MNTVTESTTTDERPRRVIKRYSNRKLYDTKASRYVTLQQIGEMVRAGEEVQIIDNATKEDKTEVTLALIISEDLRSRQRAVPLGTLRDLIQERGERLLSQLREGPIGRLIPGPPAPDSEPGGAEAPAEAGFESPQADARSAQPKIRLTDLVESSKQTFEQWQQAVDERVRAILPALGLFKDLQGEVERLTRRVEALEASLAAERHSEHGTTGDASTSPSTMKE